MSVKLLDSPTDEQIDESVALLTRAFAGDISVASMTGGNKGLEAPLFKSMLKACAVEGAYYVVMDDEEDKSAAIRSVGAWFGPGRQMFGSEKQREQGWTELFDSLPEPLQKWWTESYLPPSEGLLNKLLGDSYLNGWYANVIATDPAFQRRGYAASIIQTVFNRAASEGKSVSLATQTKENALWYQRLGFKKLGMGSIPGETGAWPFYVLTCENPEQHI